VVKTIGLIALMAQMGLHVPAREAVLPVFDQVFADIGDQQSIAANLSTFTAHMRNISEMVRTISPPALILIDEVGTGTDPDEGAALAVAIVDYFRRSGVTTIATTHYNPLKMWAARTEGVLNASVEFDMQMLQPTYRLIVGVAGASSGLQIARRMGVPQEILDEARQLLDPAHARASAYLQRIKELADAQEDLRAALEEERKAVAEKYERLETEFARREAERGARFSNELERVIGEFSAESQRLLADLHDQIAAARIRKQTESRAAGLRRSARTLIEQDPVNVKSVSNKPRVALSGEPGKAEEIQERDRVFIKSLKREGIVESVRDATITVSVGSLKFRAAREEIQLIGHASSTDSRPAPGISVVTTGEKEFSPELKVIGMTSDEALDHVDKFLDQAYLAEAESVRIVHGHGKGVLRRAIAKFLEQHPLAASFEPAPPQQGGSGATIVTLRKD
jgi:DNA mismatch repair protein MutS2